MHGSLEASDGETNCVKQSDRLAIHQNITVENGDDSAPVFSEKWLRGKPVAENTNCESIHKRPVGFDEIVSEVIRMCEAAMVKSKLRNEADGA